MDNLLESCIAGAGSQPRIPMRMLADSCVLCPHDVPVASITGHGIVAALLGTHGGFALECIDGACFT